MSRSYKKTPACCWVGVTPARRKFAKKQANRRVRRLPVDFDIPNGLGYQQVVDVDVVSFYKERQPWEREYRWMVEGGYEDEYEQVRRMWERLYYCK